ncbi:MAG TPA: hypothetical protein VK272_14455 [Solirubrobacteraceae bacterium]|nr:hypothetical protein [Solirubrobacteraceae bacterium]
MTATRSTTSTLDRGRAGHASDARSRRRRARSRRKSADSRDQLLLGRHVDRKGRAREVIVRCGAAGSVLVIDRDSVTHADNRLVAHLAADEPAENAALVCRRYLRDVSVDRGRCRPLTPEDARSAPFVDEQAMEEGPASSSEEVQPTDRHGNRYRLAPLPSGMSIPELRWCRSGPGQEQACGEPVSVREVIAALESYQPVYALTSRALALHGGAGEISTTVLRAELARTQASPIVLNKRLREIVLATIERQQLSMSEIALRCGRVKRDRKGNESGETSWLARRVGLLPEGGGGTPTPWIHSDVLALIARRGLGVSPREVEL